MRCPLRCLLIGSFSRLLILVCIFQAVKVGFDEHRGRLWHGVSQPYDWPPSVLSYKKVKKR